MRARQLSADNQQKVVIGKWLVGEPSFLSWTSRRAGWTWCEGGNLHIKKIAGRQWMRRVRSYRPDLEEVRRLCNRILVLRDGAIVEELKPEDASADELLTAFFREGGLHAEEPSGKTSLSHPPENHMRRARQLLAGELEMVVMLFLIIIYFSSQSEFFLVEAQPARRHAPCFQST